MTLRRPALVSLTGASAPFELRPGLLGARASTTIDEMRWPRASTLPLALLASSWASGCDVETVYVDPPVVQDGSVKIEVTGDPFIEVGFYNEQLYKALSSQGDCPIVHGLQGGTWSMPAIRTQGIARQALLSCSIVTAEGETVGEAALDASFYATTDGFFEVQAFPIPIKHEDDEATPEIDDLFGTAATMTCFAEDSEGRSDATSVEVILTEG